MRRSGLVAAAVVALVLVATTAIAAGNDHAEDVQGNVTLRSPGFPAVGLQCAGGDWTYLKGSYRFTGNLNIAEAEILALSRCSMTGRCFSLSSSSEALRAPGL